MFNRLDYTTFYVPEKMIFYVGKKQRGGGIFCFSTLKNKENESQKIHKIYEVNEQLDDWETTIGYYIPTVYVNGRGNLYKTAESMGNYFNSTPTFLEPLNMLSGDFYAYYTSDGYSTSFKLPYINLKDNTVICRIYITYDEYVEWVVYEGSNDATAFLFSTEIKMIVNREKGTVSFYNGALPYAIPRMDIYFENNIRVFAEKDMGDCFDEVVSSHCNTTVGSKIIFAGGKNGNSIFYTKYDNPLYFPQNFLTCGNSGEKITNICSNRDKILILKPNEVYTLEFIRTKNTKNSFSLPNNNINSYENENYNLNCINSNLGCSNKKTVANCGDAVIWLSADGEICTANENLIKVNILPTLIKSKIEYLLKNSSITGCGIFSNEHYILFFENKAIIMKYNGKGLKGDKNNLSFYYWDFPYDFKILSVFSNINQDAFLCCNSEGFYISILKDGFDEIIIEGSVEKFIFDCHFKSKNFDFGEFSKYKNIKKICMQFKSTDDAMIIIGDEKNPNTKIIVKQSDFNDFDKNSSFQLPVNMTILDNFNFEIKTKGDFFLSKTEVFYNELIM